MEFENPDNSFVNLLLGCSLTLGVWLSKSFHFSLTAFINQFSDIDFGVAAKCVDALFHYGLLFMTFAFTFIKFFDYLKHRKK